MASRIAARSTTAGTPVKSWRMTRDGMNGSSMSVAAALPRPPAGERLDVLRPDDPAARVAQGVLEQDLDRHRDPSEVDSERPERVEPVQVGSSRAKAGAGAERVVDRHRVVPRWVARIDGMEAYPER